MDQGKDLHPSQEASGQSLKTEKKYPLSGSVELLRLEFLILN